MSIFSSPPPSKRKKPGLDVEIRGWKKPQRDRLRPGGRPNAISSNRNATTGLAREQLDLDPTNLRGIQEGFEMLSDEFQK